MDKKELAVRLYELRHARDMINALIRFPEIGAQPPEKLVEERARIETELTALL